MPPAAIQPKHSARRVAERRADAWRVIAVCAALVIAVLLVFGQTLRQGFANVDDGVFVYDEPHVSGGLSLSGIAWAFTRGPVGEWYPLSMLSHMLDCQLYGLNPAGHHLTNVLLHAASAVTLFLVMWRMSAALWPSALVAALFALHPLHVESVAWVAERRDVLSGLFFVLTLGAYGEYVRQPQSRGLYLAVVGLFALGLMAKPILVTLPPLLMLLDFWPLGRFRQKPPNAAAPDLPSAPFAWRAIVDKLPLFTLAIVAAAVTILTHSKIHDPLTLPERLANAAVACVAYLGQLFVPVGLLVFYPHPVAGWPAWHVAAAVLLLLAITVAAVIGRRSYPYFFVGWFWYVGMLVPVLGLTSVGGHARADRYTYLSQIGLYIVLVWGAMRLGKSSPARHSVFRIGSALLLAALMACSWRQTSYWRDNKTLWEHALACDPKNVTALASLGAALEESDDDGAAARYRQVLELGQTAGFNDNFLRVTAHFGLGNIAARKGDFADARAHYEQALELDSDFAPAHSQLGGLLAKNEHFDEAIIHFRRSIELAPNKATDYCNLSMVLSLQGEAGEAIANCRKALAIDPNSDAAHSGLAVLLAERGDVNEAIFHFGRAIEIDPDVALPYFQMAELLRTQGKISEAAKYQERGINTVYRYAESQNLRGSELIQQGRVDEAIAQFEIAITAFPDYAQAHTNLADAMALQGNRDGAIAHYRRALEINPNFAPAKRSFERLLNR